MHGFLFCLASHNYCTLHPVTEQTAHLVLESRVHEGAAAEVRGVRLASLRPWDAADASANE